MWYLKGEFFVDLAAMLPIPQVKNSFLGHVIELLIQILGLITGDTLTLMNENFNSHYRTLYSASVEEKWSTLVNKESPSMLKKDFSLLHFFLIFV